MFADVPGRPHEQHLYNQTAGDDQGGCKQDRRQMGRALAIGQLFDGGIPLIRPLSSPQKDSTDFVQDSSGPVDKPMEALRSVYYLRWPGPLKKPPALAFGPIPV